MKRANGKPLKARGRPREFDRDAALERAIDVFWRHGYEATSVSDLTAAMDINPPSLYAAFGDKEKLFLEAVERYQEQRRQSVTKVFDEAPTAREAVHRLLREAASRLACSGHPRGCMLVMSDANCSDASAHVHSDLAHRPRRGRRRAAARHGHRRAGRVLHDRVPGHVDAGARRRHPQEAAGDGGSGDARLAAQRQALLETRGVESLHPARRGPMPKRLPGSREEDSWLSERQLAGLTRADQADELRSPVPTQVVSNGEYFPLAQTLQQRQVEVRIAELAGEASKRLGMSRRRFLASSGGMAAAFLAMNEVFGRFFDVNPLELMGPAHAAAGVPGDLFVFDDQLHMICESFSGPLALRAMSQGAGPAASAAGFDKNPFNAEGLPDELGRPWSAWNPSLGHTPISGANFHLVKFIKDVYLDSQVAVAVLSNAPLGLFEPPDSGKPRIPRNVDESLSAMNLTGFQTAAVRDWVNHIAGSTRLLAHGQVFPGKHNLGFMQQQIDRFHPDSWKGYNIAYTAKLDADPESELKQWRLDDEQVAYPTYELIRDNRKELEGIRASSTYASTRDSRLRRRTRPSKEPQAICRESRTTGQN